MPAGTFHFVDDPALVAQTNQGAPCFPAAPSGPFLFPITRCARRLLESHKWAIASWQLDAARAVLTAEVNDYDGNAEAAQFWLAVFDDRLSRDVRHQLSDSD